MLAWSREKLDFILASMWRQFFHFWVVGYTVKHV